VGAHQVSNMHSTDLPMLSPTPLDQDDSIAWPGYFPASHLLTRLPCWFGSHATTPGAPSRRRTLWVGEMVSITSSVWTVLRRYGNRKGMRLGLMAAAVSVLIAAAPYLLK
jgi:hypothetical protein